MVIKIINIRGHVGTHDNLLLEAREYVHNLWSLRRKTKPKREMTRHVCYYYYLCGPPDR